MESSSPTGPASERLTSRVMGKGADRLRALEAAEAAELLALPAAAENIGGAITGNVIEIWPVDPEAKPISRVQHNAKKSDVVLVTPEAPIAKPLAEPAPAPVPTRVSRVRSSNNAKKSGDVLDTNEIEMPRSFTEMRPESGAAKVMIADDKDLKVELRQSSKQDHQDGVAYNPRNRAVVVCDGLGGIGQDSDAKNNFGFALAHATAELDDISTLSSPEVVASIVERAKTLLSELGITVERPTSRVAFSTNALASTIAAIQNIEGTKKWRVATIGDSSVVLLGADGSIRRGFGEAFQLIAAGKVDSRGMVEDGPMGSFVGISHETLTGTVSYERVRAGERLGAEFTEVELQDGEKLVLASDAYIQKSPPSTLEGDVKESAEAWKARKPTYSDDTTLAIVG